jgi:hypothetical protein
MSKSWHLAMAFCSGLLMIAGTFAQDIPTPPADASVHNHLITDCMAQQDPALKKEDALQICQQKLKQGIKIKKKKQKPADTQPNDAAAPQK